jgi:nucleotide-binding universal stress UspA family protein
MAVEHEHTIVLGFDGSKGAERALDWAVQEAKMRGDKLCIIRAWTVGEFGTDAELGAYTEDELQKEMSARLDGSGVDYECMAIRGPAAKVLVEHSADADMLVVGSRGLGGFTGLLLGSVSHQVSTHSGAPVVVIVREP